ncbi:MAG: TlyA family rRNA (cytidine-2'-O)-methyltransferase [Desulfobulbaceae bacterium DB1]|nr:MAG: TlyA family rRNA (cytidine-2'-O)-methyltransferase [Desulfobulbaceae bacterium DB1]
MKLRLDKLLLLRNLAESRHKAQALIGAGQVLVNGRMVDKAGTLVGDDATIDLKEKCPYVSRGGLKLARALEFFALDPTGLVCADIGASTGGFTDCLLQAGAARVYAVDVGYGQLDWKLRQDSRVVVMERTNARHLQPGDIPELLDLAVIDASFISLKLLLPPILPLLKSNHAVIALIKPQFEVGKGKVGKGGVVRNQELHAEVVEEISRFAASLQLASHGVIESPILGPKGNKEFLIYLGAINRLSI